MPLLASEHPLPRGGGIQWRTHFPDGGTYEEGYTTSKPIRLTEIRRRIYYTRKHTQTLSNEALQAWRAPPV